MHRLTLPTRFGRKGFTIVELLVVIGVITVLMGLILAGLQAAGRAGRKTRQLNDLRQVYTAWSAYAGTYGDYVLPGRIDAQTQQNWRVKYRYQSGGRINPDLAADYAWRLMSYLDWSYQVLYSYYPDFDTMNPPTDEDINTVTPDAVRMAEHPAFGYNAIYTGGVWEADASGVSSLRYGNSEWTMDSDGIGTAVDVKGKLVARSLGSISQPSNYVIFCDSTFREPGVYRARNDFKEGAAWAVPHIVAETEIWAPYVGMVGEINANAGEIFGDRPVASLFDSSIGNRLFGAGMATIRIEIFQPQAVPFRRHGDTVATLHADGNTTALTIPTLTDQRKWINAAIDGLQQNDLFTHTP